MNVGNLCERTCFKVFSRWAVKGGSLDGLDGPDRSDTAHINDASSGTLRSFFFSVVLSRFYLLFRETRWKIQKREKGGQRLRCDSSTQADRRNSDINPWISISVAHVEPLITSSRTEYAVIRSLSRTLTIRLNAECQSGTLGQQRPVICMGLRSWQFPHGRSSCP